MGNMTRALHYILLGYLWGSILSAKVAGRLLGQGDPAENSSDGNPGTFNAFQQGGFACGVLTLLGDLLKGLVPVALYLAGEDPAPGAAFALVLAAPVAGHIFPIFYRFHGGKGIATTFGCLLALLPNAQPAAILACCFLFFTLVLRVTPNYYRTWLAYLCAGGLMLFLVKQPAVRLGFGLITLLVLLRLAASKEEKQDCKVGLLWMR